MEEYMELKDVKYLVKILLDKAALDMNDEVGTGSIFSQKREDELRKFNVKKYIKSHTQKIIRFGN